MNKEWQLVWIRLTLEEVHRLMLEQHIGQFEYRPHRRGDGAKLVSQAINQFIHVVKQIQKPVLKSEHNNRNYNLLDLRQNFRGGINGGNNLYKKNLAKGGWIIFRVKSRTVLIVFATPIAANVLSSSTSWRSASKSTFSSICSWIALSRASRK